LYSLSSTSYGVQRFPASLCRFRPCEIDRLKENPPLASPDLRTTDIFSLFEVISGWNDRTRFLPPRFNSLFRDSFLQPYFPSLFHGLIFFRSFSLESSGVFPCFWQRASCFFLSALSLRFLCFSGRREDQLLAFSSLELKPLYHPFALLPSVSPCSVANCFSASHSFLTHAGLGLAISLPSSCSVG